MRFVLVCFTAMSHRARAICGSWSVCVTGISFQTRLRSLICRKKQSSLWHPGAVVYLISEMTILQSHWHFSGFLRVLVTILRYLNMSLYTCLLVQAKHCKFNVLPLCSAFVFLGGLSVRQQGDVLALTLKNAFVIFAIRMMWCMLYRQENKLTSDNAVLQWCIKYRNFRPR